MDNKNRSSPVSSFSIYHDYCHNMGKVQYNLGLHPLFTLIN